MNYRVFWYKCVSVGFYVCSIFQKEILVYEEPQNKNCKQVIQAPNF